MPRKHSAAIRMLVLDVDGVMTDGRLHFGPRGEALKLFHVRDGLGIQQVAKAGIEVAVISGRKSKMVDVRCRELGISHVFQGVKNKVAVLEKLCARLKIEPAECACVGDDLPDIPVMRTVALAFAVADAHNEARHAAHLITKLPGGHGAVREVCDYLLAHRGLPHRPKGRAS
ncbi:MAG TPA: HAD-IIIA family hydrolase [Steroidobacteraceae bacterium]|nr:HAD-IIIA family hydrolase [Steroidobacteraceae bacterium]